MSPRPVGSLDEAPPAIPRPVAIERPTASAAPIPDEPPPARGAPVADVVPAAVPSWTAAPSTTMPAAAGPDDTRQNGTTAPQLRRFIKSRPYVPLHELRRRFVIDGPDDEVTPIDVEGRRLFVGLPDHEGRLLGELLGSGDVGYELSHDPVTPIVIGVFPMRPVART